MPESTHSSSGTPLDDAVAIALAELHQTAGLSTRSIVVLTPGDRRLTAGVRSAWLSQSHNLGRLLAGFGTR
ncbi:MAG: hypothetical protein ABSG43_25045, partial [Solirubrobacteraceae bacterium]